LAVIKTHEHKGDFKEWWSFGSYYAALPAKGDFRGFPLSGRSCVPPWSKKNGT